MNKTKYLSLSLLLSFISCDLILNDELKDKSVDLLDQIHTVLDAKNDNNIQKNGVLKKFKKIIYIKTDQLKQEIKNEINSSFISSNQTETQAGSNNQNEIPIPAGGYSISGFAGGGPLKGEEGETRYTSLTGTDSTPIVSGSYSDITTVIEENSFTPIVLGAHSEPNTIIEEEQVVPDPQSEIAKETEDEKYKKLLSSVIYDMQDTFHWIKKIKESPSKFYTERFILQSSAISVQINYNKYYNATHQDSQNNDDANKAKEYLEEASVKVRKMGRSYKYDANDLSTLEENFQKTKELLEKLMASHSKR